MTPTLTYIGLAIAVAVLIVANVPWGSVGAWFKGTAATPAKPDRIAMRAAYDVLKAGLGDDPDLKAIWGKLS